MLRPLHCRGLLTYATASAALLNSCEAGGAQDRHLKHSPKQERILSMPLCQTDRCQTARPEGKGSDCLED